MHRFMCLLSVVVAVVVEVSGQCTTGSTCVSNNGFTVNWSVDNSSGVQLVTFDLSATNVPFNGWVAVGFNNVEQMSSAFMVECVYYNGVGMVIPAYATGRNTPQQYSTSGIILPSASVSYSNNELRCTFTRPFDVMVSGLPLQSLSQQKCLIAAKGTAMSAVQILRHSTSDRLSLGCVTDFSQGGVGRGASTQLMVGVIVGVVVLVTIGLVILYFTRGTAAN